MVAESLKRKKIASLILFLIYLGCVLIAAQEPPRTYIAYKTIDSISIDGEMNEASWGKSEWTQDFVDIEGVKDPAYRTRIKMVWDVNYLYVSAELEEPHVWGTLKQRDTVLFYNNDFEIFIDPDGDTHNYYELEINALNTVWDLFLTKPYRNDTKVLDSWDIQGLKTAISIDGSLNNASDTDKGWKVEIAIPWKVLIEASTSNNPPENSFWRMNFSRVNWDYDIVDGNYSRKKDETGKFLPEYNWVWSPQWVIAMHEPEKWGYVYFSNQDITEKTSFKIPEDEYIKWYLYELYRDLNTKKGTVLTLPTKGKEILGAHIVPTLSKHDFGWNLWVKSPFSNEILSIQEDGKFSRTTKK